MVNCISRLCPSPLPPPPPPKHPNRVKNTQRGHCAITIHRPLNTGRGAVGKGRSRSSVPSPRADCPPPVVHGGTEGRVGQDYVSSELALPCARSGMDTHLGDAGATASGAPSRGQFVGGGGGGGGCRTGSPIESRVAWRPWRRGAVVPGPAQCAPRAMHCALSPVVHCVPYSVLVGAVHCVWCAITHCALPSVRCVLQPVVHCVQHPVAHCVPCSVLLCALCAHCRGAVRCTLCC